MAQSSTAGGISIRTYGHFIVQPQRFYCPSARLHPFVYVAWVSNDTGYYEKQYSTYAIASLVSHGNYGELVVGNPGDDVETDVSSQQVEEWPGDTRLLYPDLAWDPNRANTTSLPSTQVPGFRPAVFLFQHSLRAPVGHSENIFIKVEVRHMGEPASSPPLIQSGQSRLLKEVPSEQNRVLSSAETWVLRKLHVSRSLWGPTFNFSLYEASWVLGHKPSESISPEGVIQNVKVKVSRCNTRANMGNISTVLMAFRKTTSTGHLDLGTDSDPHPMTRQSHDLGRYFNESWQDVSSTIAHTYQWTCTIQEKLELPREGKWLIVAWVFNSIRSPEHEVVGRVVQHYYRDHIEGGPKFARCEEIVDWYPQA
ncbi:hypothetical protein B0T21DRAFT_417166 [Apiosordaria backusii]|uniref:Uncharacterized protein n=1 Tax=Apiosordaria backusii TaxID=314023 RepID=A0AA39ZPZ7_9PEZI|nr:hypothetical protein B0T21DRAFT_417166 [Apiosordaria backusii]